MLPIGSAGDVLRAAISEGRRALDVYESLTLISNYGIEVCETRLARSPDEAVAHAEEIGYPVVLKVASPDVLHKSDVGGLAVGLSSPADVRVAYSRLVEAVRSKVPHARLRGVVVQEMVEGGYEAIVGGYVDDQFGPVVMYGLGGVLVELFRDVAFEIAPVTEAEALEMVSRTKSFRVLTGYRGRPRADVGALCRLISRASQMVWELRDVVRELDMNPVFVLPEGSGCKVADARVVLRRPGLAAPTP